MDNSELNDHDLLIEIFYPHEPESVEDNVNLLNDPPIRVTHRPTGLSAIGEGQGSQVRNKKMAMEILEALLSRKVE